MQRGLCVIHFDNRDEGLSSSLDWAGHPNLALGALRCALGWRVRSVYTLTDIAADSVGVLDGSGVARAHVCGASRGGMIAKCLADLAPDRVKSLTLMTTSGGSRKLLAPLLRLGGALIVRVAGPESVESVTEQCACTFRSTASFRC